MEKAVIYARVSSHEQEETGYSLPSQTKSLGKYGENIDLDVIKTFSIAESASGHKQRKVFAEMMEFATKNGVTNLLCEKVDRLTRNLKEAVVVNDWLEGDEKRKVHFVKQNLIIHKNAKSDEKFRWDIEIVLAKKYITNLSEEVKKGQKEKLAQGWLPTTPPLGYKTIGDKGKKIHIIDEEKAFYIKKMFEYYSSGNYSLSALVDKMYQEGLRTRNGGKLVKSRLDDLLSEPFYYGAMRWKDAFYTNGSQEPLINEELYSKVQNIKTRKDTPHYKRHVFQFSKKIKCGECNGTITAELQRGHVYYHCTHYRNCSQKKHTREEVIEEQLIGVFDFFANLTEKESLDIRNQIKKNHATEIEYKETTLLRLQEQYNRLQRRLDNLYDDKLDEKITNVFWERKNKEITNDQKLIQDQINKLKNEEAKYFELYLNILDLAHRAKEIYERRSPEERRLLLSHIFSNLMLKDGKVMHKLQKPLEILSKRVQERIDAKNSFEQSKTVTNKRQKDSFEPLHPSLLRR